MSDKPNLFERIAAEFAAAILPITQQKGGLDLTVEALSDDLIKQFESNEGPSIRDVRVKRPMSLWEKEEKHGLVSSKKPLIPHNL